MLYMCTPSSIDVLSSFIVSEYEYPLSVRIVCDSMPLKIRSYQWDEYTALNNSRALMMGEVDDGSEMVVQHHEINHCGTVSGIFHTEPADVIPACVLAYSFVMLSPGMDMILLTHSHWTKWPQWWQMIFSNAFSWMKIIDIRFNLHWNLFPGVQLTISQHWFRQWFGAE